MKDKFEKFIIRNREEFDDKNPGNEIWSNIEKELYKEKKYNFSKTNWMWKAAAIFFIALSSFLLYDKYSESGGVFERKGMVSDEFQDIENYYISQINIKEEEINNYLLNDPHIDSDFKDNLGKLDAMYLVLKNDLENRPSQEVIDALILNLIMRIDILNNHLFELERKSSENDRIPAS